MDGIWEYPPLETAMEETGFEEMGTYALKRQNTVTQYIATRPIVDRLKGDGAEVWGVGCY